MHPEYVLPPHCPNFATGEHVTGGVVGTATALVTNVVGAAETLGSGEVGWLGVVLPLPFHTAGPGTGYVVAFMASGESMLKLIPGSDAE